MKTKKFKILIGCLILLLTLIVISKNGTARDESARQSAFTDESAFSESAFETKEVRGEEVEGVPDPPDENGPEIDTPINDSMAEIILFLVAGSAVIFLTRRRKHLIK